jgi:NAD(P)-dependent dehydrogenase (short-subunit alcohol dehydrogenase family)
MQVKKYIQDQFPGSIVDVVGMDLSSLKSVYAFSRTIEREIPSFDILINNAGVWPHDKSFTSDGFELSFQVNHLSPFLLTNLLLPHIAQNGRIVHVSSGLHFWGVFDVGNMQHEKLPFSGDQAYRNAKLLNVIFSNELQRRLEEKKSTITSTSLHPGIIATALHRDDYAKKGWWFRILHRAMIFLVGKSSKSGAQTTLYAALSSGLAGQGGLYLSDCAAREPHTDALNTTIGRGLWEESLRLLRPMRFLAES